ncbi:MAG: hypothetical protein ACYSSO_10385, partial [Planctomycetota bacterium]
KPSYQIASKVIDAPIFGKISFVNTMSYVVTTIRLSTIRETGFALMDSCELVTYYRGVDEWEPRQIC